MGLMYRFYRAMQVQDGCSQASIPEFEEEGEEEPVETDFVDRAVE